MLPIQSNKTPLTLLPLVISRLSLFSLTSKIWLLILTDQYMAAYISLGEPVSLNVLSTLQCLVGHPNRHHHLSRECLHDCLGLRFSRWWTIK